MSSNNNSFKINHLSLCIFYTDTECDYFEVERVGERFVNKMFSDNDNSITLNIYKPRKMTMAVFSSIVRNVTSSYGFTNVKVKILADSRTKRGSTERFARTLFENTEILPLVAKERAAGRGFGQNNNELPWE